MSESRKWMGFWIAFAALALGLAYVLLGVSADHDEVEHAAIAARLIAGEIPYVDFSQNHMPYFWYFLIPIVKIAPDSISILYVTRFINCLLYAVSLFFGVRILRQITNSSKFATYSFLLLALCFWVEFKGFYARPDMTMASFTFFAYLALVKWPSPTLKQSLLIGVLLGLSSAISLKTAPQAIIPPLIFIVAGFKGDLKLAISRTLQYGFGYFVAWVPLILCLSWYGAFQEFYDNVMQVNNGLSSSFMIRVKELLKGVALEFTLVCIPFLFLQKKIQDRYLTHVLTVTAGFILCSLIGYSLVGHYSNYNLLAFTFPASFALTLSLFLLVEIKNSTHAVGIASYVLPAVMLVIYFPIFTSLEKEWSDVHLNVYEEIGEVVEDQDTCLALAPLHPVKCKNIGPTTQFWDLTFLHLLPKSSKGRQIYIRSWKVTVEKPLSEPPNFWVWGRDGLPSIPQMLLDRGAIDNEQHRKIQQLAKQYEKRKFGQYIALIKKAE